MTGVATASCGSGARRPVEGVVTKKGPFDMGGVGGLAALTIDEWIVPVPLTNGNKQAAAP